MRPIAVSVDVHTHGGRTGITSDAPPSGDIARDMRAGSLAAACLADVPDGPILGRNAEGALAVVATKSLLLSHTAVLGSRAMGATPLTGRQITADHERMIAETGGAVGIWNFFATLDRYVEGLKEMADIVGVDHVSIGTDQHVTPGSVPDYTQWVHLVAAMLRGGFTSDETGKIAGGNYLRIFRAAVGKRTMTA